MYVYSAALARLKWLGNWLVALGTAAAIMFGAFVAGAYALAAFLALAAFFANAGREITKDLEDLEADRGRKTTLPLIAGEAGARAVAGFCFCLAAAFASYPASWPLLASKQAFLFVLIAGVLGNFVALVQLFRREYKKSQVMSKASMAVLLLAYAATLL
jgi:4-hydroxybenzoate polyprenyltransferase